MNAKDVKTCSLSQRAVRKPVREVKRSKMAKFLIYYIIKRIRIAANSMKNITSIPIEVG